ncbi:MAG: glycosyltransferase family 39 protein, partial [Chloroflexota bacterium]
MFTGTELAETEYPSLGGDGRTAMVDVGESKYQVLALPAWLTLEVALYIGLLALAAGLRLWGLGDRLLSSGEAQAALAAWHATRGEPTDLMYGPTLVYGSTALFFVFSADDLAARLLPALCGVVVVAWPLLMREHLGRKTALFATLLLAISPSSIQASRTVSGGTIALALLLLTAWAWARFRETQRTSYLVTAGVTAGLGLASGPAIFALLVPLGLAVLDLRLAAPKYLREFSLPKGTARRFGLVVLAALVAASTGLLSQPFGLQTGVINAFATWAGGYFAGDIARSATAYAGGLAIYELAVLVPALVGLVVAEQRRTWLRFLVGWAGIALVISMLSGTARPDWLLFVAFPLALAAAQTASELWERGIAKVKSSELAIFLAFTLPTVGLWGTVAGYQALPTSKIPAIVLLVPPAVFLMIVLPWLYWRGSTKTVYSLGGLVGVVLLLFGVHTAADLNLGEAANPSELLVGRTVDPDFRLLVEEIGAHTAVLATPGSKDVPILVDERYRYPLAWYLREYSQVSYGDVLAKQPTMAVFGSDKEP